MNRLRQQGQVVMYLLGFTTVLSLATAYVFNASSLMNEKTRIQNTTDAVAYSVATVEARDLNFKAYTNRAMVANQVAIGQAVGLVSWVRWLDNTSRNLAAVSSWIPYVNAVTRAVRNGARAADRVMEPLMRGAATFFDGVVTALALAQNAMHYSSTVIAADTIRSVAHANDPDIEVGITLTNSLLLADYARQHRNFTRRFSPEAVRDGARSWYGRRTSNYREHKSRMDEFRNITMASRDRFSVSRNYRYGPRMNLAVAKYEMRRAGGTELVGSNRHAPYGSWIAMDTLSFHDNYRGCGWSRTSWCGWDEWFPIGWGAAKNARRGERINFRNFRGRGNVGGSWHTNRKASTWAAREYQGDREVELGVDYLGLRRFYDLTLDGLMVQGPGIKILLSKREGSIDSARELGYNEGDANIEEYGGLSRSRLAAMAEASPYFARINDRDSRTSRYARADNMREYGNLYNPYWQARLSTIGETEKRALQALAQTL